MIVTNPNQIDLTGTDPNYIRIRRFNVFQAGQLINLEDSAYKNSLKVYIIRGYNPDNTFSDNDLLQEVPYKSVAVAKTWYIQDDNKDITNMAKAKNRYKYERSNTDPTVWDFTLVNSFYMGDSYPDIESSGEYEILVKYQGLEIECSAINRDDFGPDYSPGLMRSLIDKVDQLYYVRNPILNTVADSIGSFYCLEEDLTGTLDKNFIENEIHNVNVANNLFVIRPICGSFYNTDSLKVESVNVDPITNSIRVFDKGTDYEVTGINQGKTAISEPEGGVYEYIIFKNSYVGPVRISYQAFGGEVTQADINTLKDIIQNIYRAFSSLDIITVSNLKNVELIRNILDRQQLVEHRIGHFQTQSFMYQMSTLDNFVNIAYISRNQWSESEPVPTSAMGEFRIQIPSHDCFIDFRLDYDLSAAIKLSVTAFHYDSPSFDKSGFEYFKKRILPKLRVIWCNSDLVENGRTLASTDRGIMLQMSITADLNSNPIYVGTNDTVFLPTKQYFYPYATGKYILVPMAGDTIPLNTYYVEDPVNSGNYRLTVDTVFTHNKNYYEIKDGQYVKVTAKTRSGSMGHTNYYELKSDVSKIIVSDKTGAKSPWELVDTNGELRSSQYDGQTEIVRYGRSITSGNNETKIFYWNYNPNNTNNDSMSNFVPLYSNGYTIFVGSIPIDEIEAVSISHSEPDTGDIPIEQDYITHASNILPGYEFTPFINGKDIDLSTVKAVEFRIYDKYRMKDIVERSQRIIRRNNAITFDVIYYIDDLCSLSCSIDYENSVYSAKLYSRTGSNSLNNKRFRLVQIDLIS